MVVLLPNTMGLNSGRKVLGVIVFSAGHPAGRFDTMGCHVMVRIFLVMAPGVITHDRVHFQESKLENEPLLQLGLGDATHAVVAVIQVENPLESQSPSDFLIISFVAEHVLADASPFP